MTGLTGQGKCVLEWYITTWLLYLLMVPVLSNTPLVTVGPEVQAHTGAIVILSSQLQTNPVTSTPSHPSLTLPPCLRWGWPDWLSDLTEARLVTMLARSDNSCCSGGGLSRTAGGWGWQSVSLQSWGWRPGRVRYNSSQSAESSPPPSTQLYGCIISPQSPVFTLGHITIIMHNIPYSGLPACCPSDCSHGS